MRQIALLIAGILLFSCNPGTNKNQKKEEKLKATKEEIENFDWLLGQWERLNEEEGKATFENWKKISEAEYSGIGFTMQNGDTIKQEKIRLTKVRGQWDLTVKVPEETESIVFNGTSHSANEFTCENTEIDFPNKIRYWIEEDRLNASVSNSEMEISFEFEKLKQ